MNSKINWSKKTIAISLMGLGSLYALPAFAVDYTSPIAISTGTTKDLSASDTIHTSNTNAATISGTGTKLVLNGGEVVSTWTSGNPSVFQLNTGGDLDINGSSVTLKTQGFSSAGIINAVSGSTFNITAGSKLEVIQTGTASGTDLIKMDASRGTIDGATLKTNSGNIVMMNSGSNLLLKNSTVMIDDIRATGGGGYSLGSQGAGTIFTGENLIVNSNANDNGYLGIFFASAGGTLSVKDSTVTSTKGQAAFYAAMANSQVNVTSTAVDVTSNGTDLTMATRVTGGQMTLKDTVVNTHGKSAYGLLMDNITGAMFKGDHLTLTTDGDSSVGIYANNKVELIDSEIITKGTSSHGVYLGSTATLASLTANNTNIHTTGTPAIGLVLSRASTNATLTDSEILSDKYVGVQLQSGGTIAANTQQILNLNNTSVTSNGSMGIFQVGGESQVNLDGSQSVVKGADGFATVFVQSTGRMDVTMSNQSKIIGAISASNDSVMNVDATNASILGDVIAGGTVNATLNNSYLEGASTGGGSGAANFTMSNNSLWKMTDSSIVNKLEMTDSQIEFTKTGTSPFTSLTVTDLNGIGTSNVITMRTDLAVLNGDLLQVTGTSSGQFGLKINNQGSASVDPTQELEVVETADGGATFALKNNVEVGGYQYGLKQVGNNWNLYSTGKASSTTSAVLNGFAGGYLLNYAEVQTLIQRMGDLRQSGSQGDVWVKGFGGQFEHGSGDFLSGFSMDYSGVQVGGDKKIALNNEDGDLYIGAMAGYAQGDQHYETGSGNVDSKTIGVYGTYITSGGLYVDTVLKYGWMKNDYEVRDTARTLISGNNIKTDGVSASIEIGQRFYLTQDKAGWYLEPQAQLSYGQQSGGSFLASNGLRVDVDSYTSTLARLGVLAGYEIKTDQNPINIYAKASYVHEFDGDIDFRMNDIAANNSYGDSWAVYGLGVTTQINKRHNLYFDVEQASGGKFDQPWAIKGGYRFAW